MLLVLGAVVLFDRIQSIDGIIWSCVLRLVVCPVSGGENCLCYFTTFWERKKRKFLWVSCVVAIATDDWRVGCRSRRSFFGGIGESFNHIFAASDTHDGCSRNFAIAVIRIWLVQREWRRNVGYIPNTSLEITIVSGDNVDTVLDNTIDQTVIGIGSLVVTLYSLEPRVLGYTQGKSVFRAKLLQLGKYAIGDDRDTFGVQAIEHSWNDLEFVLNSVGDEIGIDEHGVWGGEGRVELEEH